MSNICVSGVGVKGVVVVVGEEGRVESVVEKPGSVGPNSVAATKMGRSLMVD